MVKYLFLAIAFIWFVAVNFAWSTESGTLEVSCGAGEYDLYVDGMVKGKCGDQIPLAAGEHKIRVSKRSNQGEKVFQKKVTIEPNKKLALTADFRLTTEEENSIGSPSFPAQKQLYAMQSLDCQIKNIRMDFYNKLKNTIIAIVAEKNPQYAKLANENKDEFETVEEFNLRIGKAKDALDKEQTDQFAAAQAKLESEYAQKITPIMESLKKLSVEKFKITSDNLVVELGVYDAEREVFPVTVKANRELSINDKPAPKKSKAISSLPAGEQLISREKSTVSPQIAQKIPDREFILIAASSNIPLPRMEAREFKQHFMENKLRAEIVGNFETPATFNIIVAEIFDDASARSYSMFSSKFVDFNDGIVYDTFAKILRTKSANIYVNGIHDPKDAVFVCQEFSFYGMRGWRLPTVDELTGLYGAYKEEDKHPFDGLQGGDWNSVWNTISDGYISGENGVCVSLKEHKTASCVGSLSYNTNYAWCVRDGSFNSDGEKVIDTATMNTYDMLTSNFIDLENGSVYDAVVKVLWTKEAHVFKWNNQKEGKKLTQDITYVNMRGWRLPTVKEMMRMCSVYHQQESHPFVGVQGGDYNGNINEVTSGYFTNADTKCVSLRDRKIGRCSRYNDINAWFVRGASVDFELKFVSIQDEESEM